MIQHWLIWFLGKDIANTTGNVLTEFMIVILPFIVGFWLAVKNRL